MITSIAIENFKAIGERVSFEVKPITLLFGANSAGKSSILQAMHYAREVFDRHNLDADQTLAGGRFIDLGGFRNFVHRRDLAHSVLLRFDLDLRNQDLPTYNFVVGEGFIGNLVDSALPDLSDSLTTASVETSIAWSHFRASCYVRRYSVTINEIPLAAIQSYPDRRGVELVDVNFKHPILTALDVERFADVLPTFPPVFSDILSAAEHYANTHPLPLERVADALPTWGQALPLILFTDGPPAELNSEPAAIVSTQQAINLLTVMLSQLIVGPGELLRNELQEYRYLGPMREIPERNHAPPRFPDPARWANGLAAWDLLGCDPNLVKSVSRWLSEPDRLNSGYSLHLKQYKQLFAESGVMEFLRSDLTVDDLDTLRNKIDQLPTRQILTLVEQESGIEVQPQDVGVGLSQLIPVITLLLSRTGDAAIEHPELNLHPRLQAELGDVLIEGALSEANRRRNFFIETHSEHLTLRVLRRIRESTRGQSRFGIAVKPTDVGVWYVDRSNRTVTMKQILLDVEGEFVQPWPEDDTLFEQDFRERYT